MDRKARTVFAAVQEPQNSSALWAIGIATVLMLIVPLSAFFLVRNIWESDVGAAVAAVVGAQGIIGLLLVYAFNEKVGAKMESRAKRE